MNKPESTHGVWWPTGNYNFPQLNNELPLHYSSGFGPLSEVLDLPLTIRDLEHDNANGGFRSLQDSKGRGYFGVVGVTHPVLESSCLGGNSRCEASHFGVLAP